jgi:hypothetical protein
MPTQLKKVKRKVKKALGKKAVKATNVLVKKGVNTGRKMAKSALRSNAQIAQAEKMVPKGIKRAVKKEGRKIKYTI